MLGFLPKNLFLDFLRNLMLQRGLHHVKFMVNDNGVIFGSANFSVSGLETGLNDLILFPKNHSERFKEFFLNLWEYGKIGTVKGFLVSPVDNPEEKGTQS